MILHFRGIGLSLHNLFHTEEGLVMSTTGYMSPEQVGGQKADPRSDIFAFGCSGVPSETKSA